MLSREELIAVDTYCQEKQISRRLGLKELGITQWAYYSSKRIYSHSEEPVNSKFLQLTDSYDASSVTVPVASRHKSRSGKKLKSASSCLSIELKTPSGMLMRVTGEMTGEMLGEIVRNISSDVQPQ